jgi:hypothetical protein
MALVTTELRIHGVRNKNTTRNLTFSNSKNLKVNSINCGNRPYTNGLFVPWILIRYIHKIRRPNSILDNTCLQRHDTRNICYKVFGSGIVSLK